MDEEDSDPSHELLLDGKLLARAPRRECEQSTMATIQKILVQHVKAHHQEGSDSIEQRIQLIEKDLKEWELAQGMRKL